MPLPSGKIESISSIPDEEVSAIDQIDLKAVVKAQSEKPTYKTYKTLLAHRRTLQCLQTNVDLLQEKAHKELSNAMENINKTQQALSDVYDSPTSPTPIPTTTRPSTAAGVLLSILELQNLYLTKRFEILDHCSFEQGRAFALARGVKQRIKKVEKKLVKKYGIRTVDDEGNPVEMHDLERVIDVMASVPRIEKL